MTRSLRAAVAPSIGRKRTLRVLGTDISLLEAVRVRAAADLGFKIEFEVLDFPTCQRKAALDPETYDVYDQCFHNLRDRLALGRAAADRHHMAAVAGARSARSRNWAASTNMQAEALATLR